MNANTPKKPGATQIYLSLAGGFLLLSLLLFFVFFGAERRNALLDRLLFEQEIGRILSITRIMPLIEGEISLEDISRIAPIEILGVGLYDGDGNPLFGMGSFPPRQMPLTDGEVSLSRQGGGSTLIYVRSFLSDGRPPRDPGRFPGLREETREIQDAVIGEPGIAGDTMPATVYLMTRVEEPGFGAKSLWLIYVVLESALAALFVLFGRMYVNNSRYRQQLESQRQLVHLGEAARTLTHEIKNPLSAIGLRLSILKKTVGDDSREDLDIIQEELDRLNELSSRIREFLKNPAGSPETVDLRTYLPELCKRMPGTTAIDIRVPAGQSCDILMDSGRLRSVVENLIVNAHEAAEGGTVELVLELHKRELRLSVLDRGRGVEAENVGRIFDPFFTTKTRGSGIGLSIARQFARAAGGDLLYAPREGGGSEFRLTVPVARSSPIGGGDIPIRREVGE
jgi:two-component system sensor histidine kinase HydH